MTDKAISTKEVQTAEKEAAGAFPRMPISDLAAFEAATAATMKEIRTRTFLF